MKCSYQVNTDCRYSDPNDIMAPTCCEECELYDNGARPTGCFKTTAVIVSIIIIIIFII